MAGLRTTRTCLTGCRHRLFHHYMQHFLFLGIGIGIGIGLCMKCDFERFDPLNPIPEFCASYDLMAKLLTAPPLPPKRSIGFITHEEKPSKSTSFKAKAAGKKT